MSFTSFRMTADPLPPQYRTPSPPIQYHEPLSPTRVANSANASGSARKTASSKRSSTKALQNGTTRRKRKSSKNEVAQSAMDNLASVVLLGNGVTHQGGGRGARNETVFSTEPPLKRPKSRHVTNTFTNTASSPSQMQWSPLAVPVADAELLLNFSQRACSEVKPAERQTTESSVKLQSVVDNTFGPLDYRSNPTQSEQSQTQSQDKTSRPFQTPHKSAPALGETAEAKEAPQLEENGRRNNKKSTETTENEQDATVNTAQSGTPGPETQFLQGIEEAAQKSEGEPAPAAEKAELAEAAAVKPQQSDSDSPSICAGCNFHRNTSLREAEFEVNSWISCDGCKSWFHFACAGFKNEREVRGVDKFRCKKCKPVYGPTTYVRKSARAHSAIDYAGLNEGIVKTSDESPEHHYIKPIKEGTIKFDPEYFARMRPELVTKEFFERGDGMKEPLVIPAAFNPRPRYIPDIEIPVRDTEQAMPLDDLPDINDASALDDPYSENLEFDQADDEGQDRLGMVIPAGLTVRKVSELYGPDERIEVIDVKSQNGEDRRWNMSRWVDYYESTGSKIVRNVISLEVSQSKLGTLIKRPDVVRDLDLQDSIWPADLKAKGDFPKVQFYCLMSVADCYTDFHIDFGGSSVYYHILKGKKTFFFIPPHEKHLKKYEEWCNSPAQNWTFLGDQTKECYRVDLSAGDTMLIPAGWIHAVWTPEDSLVIGGNFLTRMHYPMQIRVTQIEKATHVARKFRYPFFQKIMWYTALGYLEDDPLPDSVAQHLATGQEFTRAIPTHLDFAGWGKSSAEGKENYHSRYYSKAELDGLPELCRYLQRTALIALGNITDGISIETRNAVKRSIPKAAGEPLAMVKKFALWSTWKRGNETIPHWAYPDYLPEGGALELTEKKVSARTLKRLDREAALQAWKIAPDRQSSRVRTAPQNYLAELSAGQITPGQNVEAGPSTPVSDVGSGTKQKPDETPEEVSTPTKKTGSSSGEKPSKPRQPACETCRKSRRACKHRDDMPAMMNGDSTPATNEADKTSTSLSSSPTTVNGATVSPIGVVKSETGSEYAKAEGSNSISVPNSLGVTTIIQTKPSGRNKACKDCRRSKRRCVHDEFGNEDPVKLAEAALPRPQAKKRKTSAEGTEAGSVKKPKRPQSSPTGKNGPSETLGTAEPSESVLVDLPNAGATENESNGDSGHDPSNTNLDNIEERSMPDQDNSSVIGGGSTEDDVPFGASSSSTTDTKHDPNHFEKGLTTGRPMAASSSLVSPPESTHTDAEQTPPAQSEPKESAPLVNGSGSPQQHHALPPITGPNRYTPDSGTHRRASTVSTNGKIADGEAISPTAVTATGPEVLQDKRRGSHVGSENEANEQSMKLIRELAAQDMGLRRRGKVM